MRAVYAPVAEPVSEMAIVDTFTRLIFGDEEGYSSPEHSIIAAFRAVDPNVFSDTHAEMGEYLRSLGVSEMIQLVSRLREHMVQGGAGVAAGGNGTRAGRNDALGITPRTR